MFFFITFQFVCGCYVCRQIVTFMVLCVLSSFLSVFLIVIGTMSAFFCDVILRCYSDHGVSIKIAGMTKQLCSLND
jgi:hypothetical protein